MIEKDPRNIKLPSTHLKSILVDVEKSDISNNPKYVRNKRRRNEFIHKEIESSTDIYSDSSSELSEDEIISPNINSLNSNNQFNKINKLEKREIKNTSKKKFELERKKVNNQNLIVKSIAEFCEHIPQNGGSFLLEKRKVKYINTCTIDNFLFSFWVMSKLIPMFNQKILNHLHGEDIKIIIDSIDNYMWDNARKIWFTNIMKGKIPKNNIINFYGDVQFFFLQYIYQFQSHSLIQNCSKNCIYNGNFLISENSNIIQFARLRNDEIKIVSDLSNKCSICKNRIFCEVVFKNNAFFVFMEAFSHFKIDEVPKFFEIQKKNFKLLCMILHFEQEHHFVSVFDLDDCLYLVDDLSTEAILLDKNTRKCRKYFNSNVSSVLYYLIN